MALRWMPVWLAGGLALLAVTLYWSLAASPIGLPESDCDKCGHVAVYLVLMSYFAGLVRAGRLWLLAGGLMAYGVGIEFLQQATGPRLYEQLDIAANAVGIAVGWLAARLGLARWAAWIEERLPRPRRG